MSDYEKLSRVRRDLEEIRSDLSQRIAKLSPAAAAIPAPAAVPAAVPADLAAAIAAAVQAALKADREATLNRAQALR